MQWIWVGMSTRWMGLWQETNNMMFTTYTLTKKSFNEYEKSTSNDIRWKFHIEWMLSYSFNVDFPHWMNKWMWNVHSFIDLIMLMCSHSFNMELPVDVVWCGSSILIQWFLWESVFWSSKAKFMTTFMISSFC